MTQEEIDGICEIWTELPNTRPGLKLPVRTQLTPEQIREVKEQLQLLELIMTHARLRGQQRRTKQP